jgi:coatomer subunit beta
MRTQGKELEQSGEYRQVLVQCVHKCAVKYPDVASAVVHILMEFLGDNATVGAPRLCNVCSKLSHALQLTSFW